MTTYTITESEYNQIIKLANKIICAGNGNLPGNSFGNDLGRDVIAMLRKLQPNTQEPCAWVGDSPTKGNGKQLFWTKAQAHAYASSIWPLYAHPAQQAKPLTIEEIDAVFQSIKYDLIAIPGGSAYVPVHRMTIVRAIEAAHGVKP